MWLQPDEAAVEETDNMNVDRQAITNKNRSMYPFILLAKTCTANHTLQNRVHNKLYINSEKAWHTHPA